MDDNAEVCKAFGLVQPNVPQSKFMRNLVPMSMVLVVSPDLKIQLRYDYPMTCGHNLMEVLRAIDSVQLSSKHRICTAANWSSNEEIFVQPTLNLLQVAQEFETEVLEVRPWFRITSLPEDEEQK